MECEGRTSPRHTTTVCARPRHTATVCARKIIQDRESLLREAKKGEEEGLFNANAVNEVDAGGGRRRREEQQQHCTVCLCVSIQCRHEPG
jgi:hypothetical protein